MTERRIQPNEFETFEALILSEQLAAVDVPALLAANPDFEVWYRARADRRQARAE